MWRLSRGRQAPSRDVDEWGIDLMDPKHGPLPPALVALTVLTGVVDAVTYLRLGHVFVANMTGNVVFLGFGLAGATDVSITASSIAIGAFAVGAGIGGRLDVALGAHRGRLLAAGVAVKIILLTSAIVVAAVAGVTGGASQHALIVLLAASMGIQNAVARRLSVPDLTTTVLTLTITGLASDFTSRRTGSAFPTRRLISVVAMLGGAWIGGWLAIAVNIPSSLGLALALAVVVGLRIWRASAVPNTSWSAAIGK